MATSDTAAPEGRKLVRAFLREVWRRERRDGIVVFRFFLGCDDLLTRMIDGCL